MTTRDDATFRAWLDDDPAGRCTATQTFDGATVRCDGQVGHGGGIHQGSVADHPVTWRVVDDPAKAIRTV